MTMLITIHEGQLKISQFCWEAVLHRNATGPRHLEEAVACSVHLATSATRGMACGLALQWLSWVYTNRTTLATGLSTNVTKSFDLKAEAHRLGSASMVGLLHMPSRNVGQKDGSYSHAKWKKSVAEQQRDGGQTRSFFCADEQ